MLYFPEPPPLPDDQLAMGKAYLRYEDVSQDGRVMLGVLPSSLGQVVWRTLLGEHPIMRLGRTDGVVPILSRFVLIGDDGTVPIGRPLEVRGAYQMGHTRDGDGQVDRLLLNLWADLYGQKGRTYAPPPEGHGERVRVGRVFGEHVCTRLFAEPSRRKVLRFDDPELPEVPDAEYQWRAPSATIALPDGAVPLDPEPICASTISFGLGHTDSNQHVNSLVYPRLFEHAALQHLAAHGRSTVILARYAEVAYRKPCFAGERVRIMLRAYQHGDRLGAVGTFVGETDPDRPRCYVHLQFAG
ncbi:MAG TPA: acyl-CoA thioesterase [Kofleriaceae bacterium]|nr:acyl-CoA thioesterase [Kofleriaceae bacterium]